MPKSKSLIINGWRIYAHSLFLDQIEELIKQVKSLRQKDPANYAKKNASKRLSAIAKLTFEIIPQDPTHPKYRQGTTLGDSYKHWFRAKFFQQYRLFFRYHLGGKIIVFAWVNDEDTKRAYKTKKDAYQIFKKMLKTGTPPNDWDELFKQSILETKRLKKAVTKI